MTSFCGNQHCIHRFCNNLDDVLLHFENGTMVCRSLKEVEGVVNIKINVSKVGEVYRRVGSNITPVNKTWRDFKHVKFPDNTNTNCTSKWMRNLKKSLLLYILEDGSLLKHLVPQKVDLEQGAESFLVEFKFRQLKGKWFGPNLSFRSFTIIKNLNDDKIKQYYRVIGLLISCFFLTLILVVYSLFRQLMNLGGMITMAHVSTLTIGLFMKAMQKLFWSSMPKLCRIIITIIMYFGLLSSFFWMNVMSFDIWWTFRGEIKCRAINRRGIVHKFIMYSLYGFGVPATMTAMVVLADNVDLTNTLNIIKPLLSTGLHDSIREYLYIPISILIVVNVLFFTVTTINIWLIKRSLHSLKDKSNKKHENRYSLYLKLFAITGINWIIDIVCDYIEPPDWFQYISDTYNIFSGVVIFAIFICKKRILVLLSKRFSIFALLSEILERTKSTLNTSELKSNNVSESKPRNMTIDNFKTTENL
ncbi:hypothetical protein evm_004500 [Chilo suppressalis]|nr:hypothetical protein evm_004500 [Chilo suppressalis]